jgi:RimJ/RimL family protein N-acetyltransferase
MKRIETRRLLLRPLSDTDCADFIGYYADETNARYVGEQKSADEAWRYLAMHIGHWQIKGVGYWALEEKKTATFVGSAGLWQSPDWPEMELGYWLVEKYRGMGYGLEAAEKCRDYARDVAQVSSLVSYIDPENSSSIRLAKNLGAGYETTIDLAGRGPHHVYRHF